MREKKVGIALVFLLVMAVVLSVKAHAADSPQTVISTNGDKTSISITDITPREDEKDEKNTQKNYTVGSYYPIEVQTAEDHGMQLLVKTFGKVLYVNQSAHTDLDVSFAGKSGVNISYPTAESGAGDSELSYIIFE